MTNTLTVYYYGEDIGTLKITKGRQYIFSYKDEWLEKEDAIPISISLPLTPGDFDEEVSMSFFSNLLPESTIREKLAKNFRISEKDSYGLLEIIGGECAGALSTLPDESEIELDGDYEEIPKDQLSDLLAEIANRPLLAGKKNIRLSLAGAQDKLPIYYDGKNIYLPKGNKASTHIIKTPISAEYPYSVLNETFCMKLAGELSLPVPVVDIFRDTHEPFYLIERYDRYIDENGDVIRMHQEDFCQALGVIPEDKYEEQGGPSLEDCFELISEHSVNPAIDKQYLLKWVMFNILIGNADSHAKNISFLYNDNGITLSPFYDLLCTNVYPDLNDSLSMKIGNRKDVRYLNINDWKKLASDIDVKFSIFPELRKELLEGIDEKILKIKKEVCTTEDEEKFISSIENVIQERSRLLLNIK